MITFCALLILGQEPAFTARPGQATDKTWTVAGTASLPDDSSLAVSLQRIERVWDAKLGKFIEVSSNEIRRRGTTGVRNGAFSAVVKSGPAGLYHISLILDERSLYTRRAPFGHVPSLLLSSAHSARSFARLADQAERYLQELQRVSSAPEGPAPGAFADFQRRLSRDENLLTEAARSSDLTATAHRLRDIYYELRNAQIWSGTRPKGPGGNDPSGTEGGFFLDPNLTQEELQKSILSVVTILSSEVKVSIATLLEELLALAPADVPAAVKEAVKLAREAPQPDETFIKALEAEDHQALQAVRASLVKK
ncbi:MAG: hypothetical protein HYY16_11415 [Planctomycetes bacterium]|nr:hypothetical protein [Planctomycetota bacterium]